MPESDNHHLRTVPLLIWILIQLISLSLGCFALPLWAHHPSPRESLAVHEMIAFQMVAAGVLFPFLFPNFRTTVIAIGLIWPFIQLAGFLAAAPQSELQFVSIYVCLWITGLAACNPLLKTRQTALIAIASVQLLILGGALLYYCSLEANLANEKISQTAKFGPLVTCVLNLDNFGAARFKWIEVCFPLLVGVAGQAIRFGFKRPSRSPLSPTICR